MAQSLYTRALDHFISFLAVKDRILYAEMKKRQKKRIRQLAIFAGASPTIVAVKVLNF